MRSVKLNLFDTFFEQSSFMDSQIVDRYTLDCARYYTSTGDKFFDKSVAGQFCRVANLKYERGFFILSKDTIGYLKRLHVTVYPLENCAIQADKCEVLRDGDVWKNKYKTVQNSVLFCGTNGYEVSMASAIWDCITVGHDQTAYYFIPGGKSKTLENTVMVILTSRSGCDVFIGDDAGNVAVNNLIGYV